MTKLPPEESSAEERIRFRGGFTASAPRLSMPFLLILGLLS